MTSVIEIKNVTFKLITIPRISSGTLYSTVYGPEF
jgi:hypothetical protein